MIKEKVLVDVETVDIEGNNIRVLDVEATVMDLDGEGSEVYVEPGVVGAAEMRGDYIVENLKRKLEFDIPNKLCKYLEEPLDCVFSGRKHIHTCCEEECPLASIVIRRTRAKMAGCPNCQGEGFTVDDDNQPHKCYECGPMKDMNELPKVVQEGFKELDDDSLEAAAERYYNPE